MDDGDYAGNQGWRALSQIKSDFNSPGTLFDPQDLSTRNNLNVTDIKYFSDYIRAKYEDMQTIVSETYQRTRSNWISILIKIPPKC